jgi:hypothetical protein
MYWDASEFQSLGNQALVPINKLHALLDHVGIGCQFKAIDYWLDRNKSNKDDFLTYGHRPS